MLGGKKKKAIQNRIKAVREHANDKIYYCEMAEKEFGAVAPPKKMKDFEKKNENNSENK